MKIPLGRGEITVDLAGHDVTVAEPNTDFEPIDVRSAAESALDNQLGPGSDLADRVDPSDDVAIVVTDKTRDVPDDVLLDVLVEQLRGAGVSREQIRVVVGLGLHDPMTDEELETMLGPYADIAVNHDATTVRSIGTVDGHPVEVGEPIADADLICSTGVVEPHQYAGFSGGAKTVVIGTGSESLIHYTHGPEMLGREGVRLGRIDGNPFREAIDAAGDLLPVGCCLNVAIGPDGILGVAAGTSRAVVSELADRARDALAVTIDGTYDAVVCGVGAPKDANLYQASRAVTYVGLGDYNPLLTGGRFVVPATLPDGAGDGTGERRCYEWLRSATDAESLYDDMSAGYEAGAQRAFVIARVLRDHDVYVTNVADTSGAEIVDDCLMTCVPSIEDALEPASDVLVVPDSIHTLLVEPQ